MTHTLHSAGLTGFLGLVRADLDALLEVMQRTAIEDLEIEHGRTRIVLRRDHDYTTEPVPAVPVSDDAADAQAEALVVSVTAQSVGRFTPAVRTGERVDAGQALGTLGTLAVSSPIEAPCGGRVREVFDAEIAEFGQLLAAIERES
jgi:biotin carboxyl carrier protein